MDNATLLFAHLTDAELVQKTLAGQPGCFEVLARRHCHMLYRLARVYSFSHFEAEDLVLDCLCTARESLPKFRKPLAFRTWLVRLIIHQALGQKALARIGRAAASPAEMRISQNYDAPLRYAEPAHLFLSQFFALPTAMRSAYLLLDVEGFSYQEAAFLLGTGESSVRERHRKARLRLKAVSRAHQYPELFPFGNEDCERVVRRLLGIQEPEYALPAGAPGH